MRQFCVARPPLGYVLLCVAFISFVAGCTRSTAPDIEDAANVNDQRQSSIPVKSQQATNASEQPAQPTNKTVEPQQNVTQKLTDPVESFKALVAEKRNVLTSFKTTVNMPNLEAVGEFEGWRHLAFRLDNFAYDIKSSDSIISPFTGIITYDRQVLSSPSMQTKEQAENSRLEELASPTPFRVQYVFQEGNWVFKAYEKKEMIFKNDFVKTGEIRMSDWIPAGVHGYDRDIEKMLH